MTTGDTEKTKQRKQFLNIVYFVDSSKTRTMKIPLGRVQLFLFCALILIGWSVASFALIGVLLRDRSDLLSNLKHSMQTVFEFESLYDGVYETAYPSGKLQPTKKVATSTEAPTSSSAAKTVETEHHKIPEKTSATPATKEPSASTKKAETSAKSEADDQKQSKTIDVEVSNPVVKTYPERMSLTFDLTNKDLNEKSEGYLWATAEFKSESGESSLLRAPLAIEVTADGEIKDHKRATFFAIRRFKRNEFQFHLKKGVSGTIVGVKIGVSDKPGANKKVYDVPLGIKVGTLKQNSQNQDNGKKPG